MLVRIVHPMADPVLFSVRVRFELIVDRIPNPTAISLIISIATPIRLKFASYWVLTNERVL